MKKKKTKKQMKDGITVHKGICLKKRTIVKVEAVDIRGIT